MFNFWVFALSIGAQSAEPKVTEGPNHTQSVNYYFLDFEPPSTKEGTISENVRDLHILQGEAVVVVEKLNESHQHLSLKASSPFSTTWLSGERFPSAVMHLELWVKPVATDLAQAEEFMDFDGAPVAFFRTAGDSRAGFYAFHETEDGKGAWLATGQTVDIDSSGTAKDWHRVGIVTESGSRSWSIEIDGTQSLVGLRSASGLLSDRFQLWLYGQVGADVSFDDILISPISPDNLEHLAQSAHALPSRSSEAVERKIASTPKVEPRRQSRVPKPKEAALAKPRIGDIHIKVVGGGRHLAETSVKEKNGETKKYALYSPGYDDNGKPKPLRVEIRCDAAMVEGTSLEAIAWAITEMGKEGEKRSLEVLAHGNFATGPTQIGEVPSQWSNKALSIRVGTNLRFEKVTKPK